MLGAILGDIIGRPYENHRIKTKDFPLFCERSGISDDTVMTLAVAEGLVRGARDPQATEHEIEQAMLAMGERFPHAGYGGMFRQWLISDDPRPYGSFGNGSAMRVSPVAWFFDNLQDVEKFAALSARITHNHPEGIKGAQAVASAVFMARTGSSKDEIRDHISEKYHYDLSRTLDDIRPGYRFDSSCQGSVPEAIIAFLESTGFEDALRNAVSLGGDGDTQAAIAGSIAEAFYGINDALRQKALEYLGEASLSLPSFTGSQPIRETNSAYEQDSAELQRIVLGSKKVVFFGGAGVSTESGIPDFRSKDGLYNLTYTYPPETMLSHSFYQAHRDDFFAFYRDKVLRAALDAQPNAAHCALARLESAGHIQAVITQNIDGLHQTAGSHTVYELHGSIHRNRCERCGATYSAQEVLEQLEAGFASNAPLCTRPDCNGPVKPEVVLYEEPLNNAVLDAAITAISNAEVLIIGGTSLMVNPAAGLVQLFRGSHLIVINKSETTSDANANLVFHESIGAVLGQI
jgi:NAD-dependent SIR2 family protein deacetylase/ADP-ribosylglycohydrolase